jgi:hypothetical protein
MSTATTSIGHIPRASVRAEHTHDAVRRPSADDSPVARVFADGSRYADNGALDICTKLPMAGVC